MKAFLLYVGKLALGAVIFLALVLFCGALVMSFGNNIMPQWSYLQWCSFVLVIWAPVKLAINMEQIWDDLR